MLGLGLGLSGVNGFPFLPSDIAELKLDLDAELGVSDTGGLIDSWLDQSGNGNDGDSLTTGRPSTGRSLPNGKAAVDFQASDWLRIFDGVDFDFTATGFTFFVVVNFDTVDNNWRPVFVKNSGAGSRSWATGHLSLAAGLHLTHYANGSTPSTLDRDFIPTVGTTYIIGARYTVGGAIEQLFSRTVAQTQTNNPANFDDDAGNLFLGWAGEGASYLDGLIGRALYYKKPLTDSEIDKVGLYLANKYGAEWVAKTNTLIATQAGQSNGSNAFSTTAPFNNDGRDVFLASVDYGSIEYLNNAASGKPLMEISAGLANCWVTTALTDGAYLTQWKAQLLGFVEGYGAYGGLDKVTATAYYGLEGDTGQNEGDTYDALEYLCNEMVSYTTPDHKVFMAITGSFGSSGFDNQQNQRNAQMDIINDLSHVYWGCETYDLTRVDNQHYDAPSQATVNTRMVNRIAAVNGKRSLVGTGGGIITSATYLGSTVTATVDLDGGAAISGSETAVFHIKDDGAVVTIDSLSISGNIITFTLSTPIATGSTVILWTNYARNAGAVAADIIRDTNNLPLKTGSITFTTAVLGAALIFSEVANSMYIPLI